MGEMGHHVPPVCIVTGLWAPAQPAVCIWRPVGCRQSKGGDDVPGV